MWWPQMRAGEGDLASAPTSDVRSSIADRLSAFAQLYEAHRDDVFRYVRRHAKSDDDAAELTAVAFARAFQSFASFDVESRASLPWLLRIARNAAIDAHRRQRRWASLGALLPGVHPRAPDDPELEALRRDLHRELAAAFSRLPLEQREALALRYGAGLTAREIGEVLGKKEAAAQKLMRRALAQLQEDVDGP